MVWEAGVQSQGRYGLRGKDLAQPLPLACRWLASPCVSLHCPPFMSISVSKFPLFMGTSVILD